MSATPLSGPVPVHRDGAPRLCLRLVAGDPVVIDVWGELAADTGHLLTELVEHVMSGGPTTVVLDLSHTRPLSVDGEAVLGLVRAAIVAAGARVRLRGTSGRSRPMDRARPDRTVPAGTANGGA
jgi:anti-anti-sigma regulatory factor